MMTTDVRNGWSSLKKIDIYRAYMAMARIWISMERIQTRACTNVGDEREMLFAPGNSGAFF